MFSNLFIRNSGLAGRTMNSIIIFLNLFMLAFAEQQIARSWGSPAWHLESQNRQNPWANQVIPVPESGPGLIGHPVQWQDSQVMNQWPEDATVSLPYPLQNHNDHSHFAALPQLFPQSQPQMNSLGPGFSPYGTPFHSVRTSDFGLRAPTYTAVLNHLDEAAKAMTKHVSLNNEGQLTDAQIQYLMVLTAVNDLTDVTMNMGTEAYSSRYKTVVLDAIAKVEKNPLPSALSIKSRISTVKSKLAGIIDLIKSKQSECNEPISFECDKTIDHALHQNGDADLQTEARFLLAIADSMELFNRVYLLEVAQVANAHDAVNFLLNAEAHIKPLVLASSEARKIGLQVKLLPLLRSNHNHNNNHLNRLDNALEYLRNRNHHDDH